MAMTLIEVRREQHAAQRSAAVAEYLELLSRNSSPLPGDADKLGRVMAVLGRSTDALPTDLRFVETLNALRASPGDMEKLAAARDAARADLNNSVVEFDAIRKDFERRLRDGEQAVAVAVAAHHAAAKNRAYVEKLQASWVEHFAQGQAPESLTIRLDAVLRS